MSYTIYQKLKSGMANQGLADADDIDVMENGQRVTLAEKLSDLTEDMADMAEDVSDAVAVADDIKTSQGQEVGDVAETDIAEGVLIWHGGKLYRVLSLIAAGDRWQDMDVTETTVSEEINAMRGVSTEGVYLTITPASAIPAGGVKARIYNASTDTYLPEVTFTSASNRHLLGQIAYGDVYTIIMPSIDGYTQPADQTFKAGQMMRDRTVEYYETSHTEEDLRIRAITSNSAPIPSNTIVTVKTYDSNGNVEDTYSLDIGGGATPSVSIPWGKKYSVSFPDLNGYFTPKSITLISSVSSRTISAKYNYLVVEEVMLVLKDLTEISLADSSACEAAFGSDNVLGIAFHPSYTQRTYGGTTYSKPNTVSLDDFHFMVVFGKSALLTGKAWDSTKSVIPANDLTVRGTSPSASPAWTGAANSDYIYQKIIAYEQNRGTVQSNNIFKYLHDLALPSALSNSGQHFFLPSTEQWYFYISKVSSVNIVLSSYTSLVLENPGQNATMCSNEFDNTHFVRYTTAIQGYGSAQTSNLKDVTSGVFMMPVFPIVSTTVINQ